MKKEDLLLENYSILAYEFAIRNSRVIQLLGEDINSHVVKELLIYGIDATSVIRNNGIDKQINSLQELYLDYNHLKHLKHTPYSPYGDGLWAKGGEDDLQVFYEEFRGYKNIIQPLSKYGDGGSESLEDAIPRIKDLIETRGRNGGTMGRLLDGVVFEHYDAVTFFGKSFYALDPTGDNKKTLVADIEYVKKWINPENYLQLIPKYVGLFELD